MRVRVEMELDNVLDVKARYLAVLEEARAFGLVDIGDVQVSLTLEVSGEVLPEIAQGFKRRLSDLYVDFVAHVDSGF